MLTLLREPCVGRPGSRLCGGLFLGALLLAPWPPVLAQPGGAGALGQPGYVVIEAVRDSSSAFAWQDGSDSGFRVLAWREGHLTIPDSLPVEDIGRRDIGFSCTALLAGTGDRGALVIRDGIFKVSEPVVLSDGVMSLEVSGGELEIRGAMIRYRRAAATSGGLKSGFLLLAGMTLLVVVLLRRARIKSGERVQR